jgi:hypothetical protein
MNDQKHIGKYQLHALVNTCGATRQYRATREGMHGFSRALNLFTTPTGQGYNPTKKAKLAARLTHPNIIQTLDLGSTDGLWFVVTEWVEGVSLADLIQRTSIRGLTIPAQHALSICHTLLRAVEHANTLPDLEDSASPLSVLSAQTVMIDNTGVVMAMGYVPPGTQTAVGATAIACVGTLLNTMLTGEDPQQLQDLPIELRALVTLLSKPKTTAVQAIDALEALSKTFGFIRQRGSLHAFVDGIFAEPTLTPPQHNINTAPFQRPIPKTNHSQQKSTRSWLLFGAAALIAIGIITGATLVNVFQHKEASLLVVTGPSDTVTLDGIVIQGTQNITPNKLHVLTIARPGEAPLTSNFSLSPRESRVILLPQPEIKTP